MSSRSQPDAGHSSSAASSRSLGESAPIFSDLADSILNSRQVLERLVSGIAILQEDLSIIWHNQALIHLCEVDTSSETGRPPQAPSGRPVEPGMELVGLPLYQALGCEEIEGPEFCPFTDCLGGASRACTRLRLKAGRHVEVTVQPMNNEADTGAVQLLCILRDVTAEEKERKKLLAIHRAGLELSNLTSDELARMSTAERIDLLKANILQYSQSILNFKNLEIRLLDAKTNVLRVLLSVGMIDAAEDRALLAETTNNGVTGFVAATAMRYACDNCEHDPLYIPGAPDARSSLTVPVIYRERVIGTFNVESPEPQSFTERDGEFLEVFAREIGMALHTLELLQAEKRIGSNASVEAIVREVSLPVDEILADGIRMLEYLQQPIEKQEQAHDVVRRVLRNARAIKGAIRSVGDKFGPRATATTTAKTEQGRLTNRRILVVDSDPAIRRSAHWLLGGVGCEIDAARDGAEALSFLRTIQYDVVVADIRLPDMNGFDLYCALRGQSPTTPMVLMTGFGYDANHSLVKARQEGLRVVLYKPFRLDRLCEAIEDALDSKAASQSGARRHSSEENKEQIL